MTVSFSPAQFALAESIVSPSGVEVDTAATVLYSSKQPGNNTLSTLFRFQMASSNVYFIHTLDLNVTLSGAFGSGGDASETFNLLITTDMEEYSSLADTTYEDSIIPEPAHQNNGSADYEVLSSITVTEYGSYTFSIDLEILTRLLHDNWNGSLLFWITAEEASTVEIANNPTLVAFNTIDYTNRDTGSRGINSSRWDRCPITGLKVPRGEMVMDGWRNILVHPDAYDPPEPDPMEWDDIPDPNEGM